jgi:hypothetical protein
MMILVSLAILIVQRSSLVKGFHSVASTLPSPRTTLDWERMAGFRTEISSEGLLVFHRK